MPRYAILSECLARETNERTGASILHRTWIVRVNGLPFYVSWLSYASDVGRPECLAFACDEHGFVSDWTELASCCCADAHMALSEVLDQLAGDEAA